MSTQSYNEFRSLIAKSKTKLLREINVLLLKTALDMEKQGKINASSYPKVVTGDLRKTIRGELEDKGKNPRVVLRAGGNVRGGVKNKVDYAQYVEFGTVKMSPRLYLKRAHDKQSVKFQKRLTKILKKALQK